MLPTFENRHFVGVFTEKMMENGARNTYSNYNQMRLMLNALQINQKIIPFLPFHRAIDETLRIPE